jgi:hypothetical protein
MGKVGGATAKHLLALGKYVRALVRHRDKASSWAPQGVELVDGDWNDSAANERALKGVEGAFVMLPGAHAGRQGAFIATAFAQEDAEAAKAQWRKVADQLRPKLPKIAACMDEAEADVLAYMDFPAAHRTKLHSTNPLERVNGQTPDRCRRHLPRRGRDHPAGGCDSAGTERWCRGRDT